MNSVRRFALVILLTIAGSLLLTEARYHGEESILIKHRHRHHRQEPGTHTHHHMTVQRPMDRDAEEYDDAVHSYDDIQKGRRPKKRLADDDDDEEDDDDDYDSLDEDTNHHRSDQEDLADRRDQRFGAHRGHPGKNNDEDRQKKRLAEYDDDEDDTSDRNHRREHEDPIADRGRRLGTHSHHPVKNLDDDTPRQKKRLAEYDVYDPDDPVPIHNRRYITEDLNADRRQRFAALRGHRTRPESRLHHTTDYSAGSRDHAVTGTTKDNEDNERIKSLQLWHYHHHHPHHHHHYTRSNEVHNPRWRNSWMDDGRVDLDNLKRWSRRKLRYRQDDDGDKTKVNSIFGERKWRSNDVRRDNSKRDDDEDIWKELGDYDDADVDDEEFDGINDDYFEDISEERSVKPPYRTYEEIIKRLTLGETKDTISVKRDYRNTANGIEKFLMKDAYGNLKFNGSKSHLSRDLAKSKKDLKEVKGLKSLKKSKENPTGKTMDADYVDDYGSKKEEDEADEDDVSKNNTVTQMVS